MAQSDPTSSIPDAPPAEVLDAVADAWERSAAFAADGLEVHVRVGRISGRVAGQLRIEDAVVERLSPSRLLALACGDPLPGRARD